MPNGVNNIHDKFFKKYLSEPSIACAFLKAFLPKKILGEIDLKSMQMSKDSYISSELSERFSDVIFEFGNSVEKTLRISILIEHKSYIDKNIYLQLLQYVVNGYVVQKKSKKPLHPIVTMIFYHGKEKWEPKSMEQLFDDIPIYIESYIPKFETIFVNLGQFSDDALQSIGNYFLSAALMLQKYSRSPKELLLKVNEIFSTLESASTRNLIRPIIVYFLSITQINAKEMSKIIEKIPSSLKPKFMSTYDNIIAEGEKRGIQKGMKQGIEKGIEQGHQENTISIILSGVSNGFTIQDISVLTNKSIEEVEEIVSKYLK